MKTLKRYRFYCTTQGSCMCDIVEHSRGEYVKFSDVEEAFRSASNNTLNSKIAEIIKCLDALNGAALSQKGTAQLTEELRQLSAI